MNLVAAYFGSHTCIFVHTCTIVPAEHYSKPLSLYLYLVFSHCVISILHITAPKVPAEHYSKLPTLYLVLYTLIVG